MLRHRFAILVRLEHLLPVELQLGVFYGVKGFAASFRVGEQTIIRQSPKADPAIFMPGPTSDGFFLEFIGVISPLVIVIHPNIDEFVFGVPPGGVSPRFLFFDFNVRLRPRGFGGLDFRFYGGRLGRRLRRRRHRFLLPRRGLRLLSGGRLPQRRFDSRPGALG